MLRDRLRPLQALLYALLPRPRDYHLMTPGEQHAENHRLYCPDCERSMLGLCRVGRLWLLCGDELSAADVALANHVDGCEECKRDKTWSGLCPEGTLLAVEIFKEERRL